MNTIRNLQIACFVAGLIGGYSFGQGFYAIAALCGVAVGVCVGLLYTSEK